MTSHALLVIGTDDPRFGEISLVKGLTVAVKASRRYRTRRAVVVTSLAERALIVVKVGSKPGAPFTFVHPFQETQHNPSVRKFDLFIFVHQGLDLNVFRDVFHQIGPFYGLSRLKETFCNFFFSRLR
jgi:hypothetical protein